MHSFDSPVHNLSLNASIRELGFRSFFMLLTPFTRLLSPNQVSGHLHQVRLTWMWSTYCLYFLRSLEGYTRFLKLFFAIADMSVKLTFRTRKIGPKPSAAPHTDRWLSASMSQWTRRMISHRFLNVPLARTARISQIIGQLFYISSIQTEASRGFVLRIVCSYCVAWQLTRNHRFLKCLDSYLGMLTVE